METTVKFVSKKVAKELHNISYLGGVATSLKIEKSLKYGIATYVLYLAPYKSAGLTKDGKQINTEISNLKIFCLVQEFC